MRIAINANDVGINLILVLPIAVYKHNIVSQTPSIKIM